MQNNIIRLDDYTIVTMRPDGQLYITQSYTSNRQHVQFNAAMSYELLTWIYDNHRDLLRQIAHNRTQQEQERQAPDAGNTQP